MSNNQSGIFGWVSKHKLLMAVVSALVVLAIVIISVLNWQRAVRAEGYEWQNNSLAKYQGVQTTLSTCLDKSLQGASVAERERSTLKDTLTSIIAQRSGGSQEAIPGNAGLVIDVVVEQYPTVSPDLYAQLMTIVTGCRDEVNGAQRDMQAYAARFDTWTKASDVFTGMIREGFPNDELVVEGPNGSLSGRQALDFMRKPIIVAAADKASKTKEMPDQTLFPTPEPSR